MKPDRLVAERVARGVAWLNEHYPGWRERIDVESLEMHEPCNCVIGQTTGNYYNTVESADWAFDHGFDIPWDVDDFDVSFDLLEEAWHAELAA